MRILPASVAAGLALAGCSGEQPATGNDARTDAAVTAAPTQVAGVPAAPAAVAPISTAAKPEAVANRFLARAVAGDRTKALDAWDGDATAGAAALAAVADAGGGPVRVESAVDGDAGMGQRYVTVPFTIGSRRGEAVLHRVADGFESDDPRAHEWRVRSLEMEGTPTPR